MVCIVENVHFINNGAKIRINVQNTKKINKKNEALKSC